MEDGMKCHKCGGVAVIGMPQHRLNLCAEHFLEWVPTMVQRAIEKYHMFTPDERVLVAVSGGKDSLGLWEILIQLGYHTEGVYINLGISHEDYSDRSQQHVEAFAAQHGDVPFRVVNVHDTYGRSIPELARTKGGRHTCALCGLVKRHIMNRIAYEGGYAAIATGHNVDDEAAVLVQNTLHWQAGYLRRQAPILPDTHPKLARKVKPLCHLYEREMAAFAFVKGIDFIEQECPFAQHAKSIFYKEILNQIERRSPGTKLQFYLSFLQAKDEGLFTPDASGAALGTCRTCGQPTTAGDQCAFCRLWEPQP
jgi:tRNA-5-methyluridine54 2-sulfurtransferase